MSETQTPAPNEEKKATDFMQLYEEDQQNKVIETAKTAYKILGWEFPQDRAEQYELTNRMIEGFTSSNIPTGEADEYGRVPVRRMNIYTDTKGIHLVTVDIHEGTTPLILRHPDNGVNMKSLCYLVPQDVEPQGEWYKPIPEVISTMPKELQKHCYDGGLILRRYGTKAQDLTMKQRTKAMLNPRFKANAVKASIIQFLRSEGAEFDEADINTLYQDFDDETFLTWSFVFGQSHRLEVNLEYCDAKMESDCKLIENAPVESIDDFKVHYIQKGKVKELKDRGLLDQLQSRG